MSRARATARGWAGPTTRSRESTARNCRRACEDIAPASHERRTGHAMKNVKTIGVIPARMQASRFPGKPLKPILGRAMIEHVYLRAKMFGGWDRLVVATCDSEI